MTEEQLNQAVSIFREVRDMRYYVDQWNNEKASLRHLLTDTPAELISREDEVVFIENMRIHLTNKLSACELRFAEFGIPTP